MKKSKLIVLLVALVLAFGVFSGFSSSVSAQANSLDETNHYVAIDETLTEEPQTMIVDGQEFRVRASYRDLLSEYYSEFAEYCLTTNLSMENMISFEEFCEGFYAQDTLTIADYITHLKENFIAAEQNLVESEEEPMIQPYSSLLPSWQYGVGTGALPRQPMYGGFTYFNSLWVGDILVEEVGFPFMPAELSGHVAIVEGTFYDYNYGWFCRIIEAAAPKDAVLSPRVIRSVLDDDRFVRQKGHLLYVPSATPTQRNNAVEFAKSQMGKPFALMLSDRPLISDQWMCSTLVWAAYMNYGYGIDISPGYGAVLPMQILHSPATSEWAGWTYSRALSYLGMQVTNRTGFISYTWTIKLTNYNSAAVWVQYNEKMCFLDDAKNFTNLSNLRWIKIGGTDTKNWEEVKITSNGFATSVTAGIESSLGSSVRFATYGDGLRVSPYGINATQNTAYLE